MLNFVDLLGRQLVVEDGSSIRRFSLEGDEGHGEYTHHAEDVEAGWEMNLGEDGEVQSIFLSQKAANSFPFGLKQSMGPQQVEALLGSPSKSAEEREVQFLGRYGAYRRFDWEHICVHVQFELGGASIHQVSLMLPKVAP